MNGSMLENMGCGETGEVLKVKKLFRLVWLAALTEAVAEGGCWGPAVTGAVNGTGVL